MANEIRLVAKYKLKVFQATPYPANVIVYDLADMVALLKVFPDHPLPDETTQGRMCGMYRDGCQVITIGLRKGLGELMPTVAHECYHALNQVYLWAGASHDLNNDEPAAYMLGHLVGETTRLWAEITDGGKNG